MENGSNRPPRDNLVRTVPLDLEVRSDGDGPATLTGHFAVFNEWTEIHSIFEGDFLEQIAPGAFTKAFKPEARGGIRVLLNHGHDPQLGDKPIGKIEELREDEHGAFYEVELFDGVPPLVVDGLRAGGYGASFRFRILREEFEREPEKAEHNPDGLPERTIKEVQLFEFGPVTFPAYEGATAGIRSLTDEYWVERFRRDPKARAFLIEALELPAKPEKEENGAAGDPHPVRDGNTTIPRRSRLGRKEKSWKLP